MSCGRCGAELREAARFCPKCGAPVAEQAVRIDPTVGDLQAEILAIAGAIQAGDPTRAARLARLASSPSGPIRVAVVGDAGRGRTTLVGQLAPLVIATVDDPPPMNPADPGFARTLEVVLDADVLIVVLTATQLLSGTERSTLLEQVFPRAVGPVAIATTRMDAVETEEDQADLDRRLARFVAQVGHTIPTFGVRRGAVGGLAAWLTDAVTAAPAEARGRWARRVLVALQGVERCELPGGPDRSTVEAAIRAEAELALAEARGRLREGVAGLRATLPDRIAAMPADRMRAEAADMLEHAVTTLGRDVAGAWLEALERALTERSDDVSRAAGAGLAAGSAGEAARMTPGAPAPHVGGSRPRNPASMALGAAGLVTLAAVGGPIGLASSAALLYGAWAVRKDQQTRFEADLSRDTRTAALAWLDGVETELSASLDAMSADVVARLLDRAFALVPEGGGLTADQLTARVAALRARLAE